MIIAGAGYIYIILCKSHHFFSFSFVAPRGGSFPQFLGFFVPQFWVCCLTTGYGGGGGWVDLFEWVYGEECVHCVLYLWLGVRA